jgi:hypothetical protein
MKNKLFLIILIPFLIWGIYFLLKDNFPFPKSTNSNPSFASEIIINKYFILESLLKTNKLNPDLSILYSIVKAPEEYLPPPSPPSPPPPKPNHQTVKNIKKQINKWDLKYIIISNNQKIALLNGKIVKIGDIINGAKIIDIKPDCVKIKIQKGIKCIYLKY